MFRLLLILVVLVCIALLVAYGLARGAVRHRAHQKHMQDLLEENRQLDEQMKQFETPSPIFGGRERRKRR